MGVALIPDGVYPSIYDLTGPRLSAKGIRLLLADLDNTLVAYGVPVADDRLRAWAADLCASGVTLFVLSNNRGPTRAKVFAEDLGVPYIGHAGKPRSASYLRAMEQEGRTPAETAMVGDQIFTDILGANNAGVAALLVEPIRLQGNPGRYLRYWAELPLRAVGKRRTKFL